MGEQRIPCPPRLDESTGAELYKQVRSSGVSKGEQIVIDLAETETMDSRGGAWLVRVSDFVRLKKGEVAFEGAGDQVKGFMALLEPALVNPAAKPEYSWHPLESFGGVLIDVWSELRDFGNLLVDTVYWTAIAPFEGKGFRWESMLEEVHEMGVRAVKINCLMNFLLGLIIAMLSAAQVAEFGLGIFVSYLIMIGFARELAALMTALVVSARTGAAISAELATMKVQEEIDALNGMGLNVAQFLIAPKLVALLLVMPCLTVMGMICGILGGAVWGVFVLDYDAYTWFNNTLQAADFGDIMQGITKSLVFAVMIVMVGCHNGLRVTGGSRGVGLMTTRAVVMDIFFLIVIDMIFALVFYYSGG
jgi:phospholipid/cholesterol/gamma-HCH transport system permease protein